jgi:preprotein translocase subunit SecF
MSIPTRPTDLLAAKVDKFITMDQSIEFREAQKLVYRHNALMENIKKDMRKLGITEKTIYRNGSKRTLKFEIKERDTVDSHAMPDDIKEQYMQTIEVWFKRVICEELGEEMRTE